MAAKTVALDSEAYELLRRSKRPGETFSEVVRRTLRPPSKISDLAGALREIPSREWEAIARERTAHRIRDRARERRIDLREKGR